MFAKQLRNTTISFVMSVCPSVHVKQLSSHWTYFCSYFTNWVFY